MTDEFEHRHGFPPGTNQVRLADHDDQAAARTLAQVTATPADLVTFYESIGDVTWEDVGNGYFLDPVGDVLLQLQEYGVVDVDTDRTSCGLVIGSNGGGLMSRGLMGPSTGRGRRRWTKRSPTRWPMTYDSFWSCWSIP
ncbi:hypothetical protein ACIGW1_27820 [Streptomyces sp. NPDC053780]|uniref:hypothetical protein n=1 Tax=unclassified Streptomyces TaxID=2593676 RepID=UPI003428779C